MIVEAYAGTGKSHSTLQFAARRQALGRRVLVLYFNKAMFTEMQVKLAEAAPGVHVDSWAAHPHLERR